MYPSVPVSDSRHLVTSLPPDAGSFAPLPLGVRLTHTIPSYSYWNFQLEQTEAGYIQFTFAIPRGSSIGESELIFYSISDCLYQGCMLGRTPSPA